jgi:phosphate:Na+ symporter
MDLPTSVIGALAWLLGGLALFLYGIDTMGMALRRAAGPNLRRMFDRATATRRQGLLSGAVVTALVQSSSASTVMVVGFINAGLLTFEHSIALILGANIGATLTPVITVFDIDLLSLPLVGIGFLVAMIGRRRMVRQIGWAVMAFGMLFFGLVLMKLAVAGYREELRGWLQAVSSGGLGSQFAAFGVAAVATGIIQSSAATIVMVQALALEGAMTELHVALPLILGAQVGTCITAILASLRASLAARRAAYAHLVFNLIGAGITLCLAYVYLWVAPRLASGLPAQIALTHVLTRVVNVLLFLPLCRLFGRFVTLTFRGADTLSPRPEFLDYGQLGNATAAMAGVAREVRRMFDLCMVMLADAVASLLDRNDVLGESVLRRESLIDDLSRTVGEYLVRVAQGELPTEQRFRPALLLHLVRDVERIGDHAENLVELGEMHRSEATRFTPEAERDIRALAGLVGDMGAHVGETLQLRSEGGMARVLRDKQAIDETVEQALDGHMARMEQGSCQALGGMIFVEAMTNLRRVANHLRNIAADATSELPERARQVHRLKAELENT